MLTDTRDMHLATTIADHNIDSCTAFFPEKGAVFSNGPVTSRCNGACWILRGEPWGASFNDALSLPGISMLLASLMENPWKLMVGAEILNVSLL